MHGLESPCEQIQCMCDTGSGVKVVKRVSLSEGRERYVGANAARVGVCRKRTRESYHKIENGSLSCSDMDRVGLGSGNR